MDYLRKIITAFELHSPEDIRECFENGIDPNMIHEGKPLVYSLINMYFRSSRFKECVRVFIDHGLEFDDKILLAVLADYPVLLENGIKADKSLLEKKYKLDCTFTPLFDASLLHICAEYNHVACAKVLAEHGADLNARAGIDENGFGGQTPVFHTVNQHNNNSMDVLRFLVDQKADLSVTIKGLVWGKGYEWETFIPAVNPLSYAMMGLLRQFQRSEKDIYENVSLLLKACYAIEYYPSNIPNRYLHN
jgi:hypothetical protein